MIRGFGQLPPPTTIIPPVRFDRPTPAPAVCPVGTRTSFDSAGKLVCTPLQPIDVGALDSVDIKATYDTVDLFGYKIEKTWLYVGGALIALLLLTGRKR